MECLKGNRINRNLKSEMLCPVKIVALSELLLKSYKFTKVQNTICSLYGSNCRFKMSFIVTEMLLRISIYLISMFRLRVPLFPSDRHDP